MRLFYSIIFLQLLFIVQTQAQLGNDECAGAIEITNLSGCSSAGMFTNQGATVGTLGEPACFSSVQNDVWFSFTAIATDVTITVVGATNAGAGGTLERPEITLYRTADCMNFNETQCESAIGSNNVVELYKGGLQVGETFYFRIQGRGGNTGTFQLCLDNYNPPVNPGSDCPTSSVLCDKSTFVVQQVVGAGNDPDEAGDSSCLGSGTFGNSESNSTWFTWTARTTGSLTFTLTPLNASDDLDFVVYELPNGVEDCSGKEELRCMASGDFTFPSPCMGPTGLREGSTDFSEPPGCNDPSQDSFLAPLDMVEGRSYALVVNNFSGTGNGFRVDFDGFGEFLGPEAAFDVESSSNEVCVGETVTFTDASTFALGEIVSWEWSFGSDATPSTASGQGAHNVSYTNPGLKTVVLTVESEKGCQVTEIDVPITVVCCEFNVNVADMITDVVCPSDENGAINLIVDGDFPPFGYQWSNGANTEDITGLGIGDYTVTITNEATCDTVLTYTVSSPDSLQFNPQIQMPTCDGGTDGSITLQTSGGTPPYEFNFGNGFSTDNTLNNIPQGDYTVTIRDANGCEESMTIEVRELELLLNPNIESVSPPSCFGDADASITIQISNGLPPYEYDFNDGNGFGSSNQRTGLIAGTYQVNVVDANLCEGIFEFVIEDPAPLESNAMGQNISCFGEQDGQVITETTGGTGNYSYKWNTGENTAGISNLSGGTYIVTVTDANNCAVIDSVTILEPNRLDAEIIDVIDALCAGGNSGSISATGVGGTSPFMYSINGFQFQEDMTFPNLPTGAYTVTVQDARGCTAQVDAFINEPEELIVDLGNDFIINLGEDARLDAQVNPPDRNVTFAFSGTDSLSCLDCADPDVFPLTTSTFTVLVTDESGCTATDQVKITVAKPRPIYIPTAFSPNGDGLNDYFFIYGDNSARLIKSLRIYDRWGELMYEGIDVPFGNETFGWDGNFREELMKPAVFVYLAEIEFIDGEIRQYDGDFAILR